MESEFRLRDADILVRTTRGSGPGGQHRNKTDSCVMMTHLPTGIEVRIDSERSQHANRREARAILESRVQALQQNSVRQAQAADRRAQVGSGMRGDKRRTYRLQDGQVTDHRSGRKAAWTHIEAGELERLW